MKFVILVCSIWKIARENEIKTVKIILSGKINGFDNEFIKERVRVMYA